MDIMFVNQCTATLVDHMGSDLTTVNAARQSFNTESLSDEITANDIGLINYLGTGMRTKEWLDFLSKIRSLVSSFKENDFPLKELMLEYKRDPQHWLPFAHNQITLKVSLPLFVARQMGKSQIGAVWSEESRRYIDVLPEVYIPDTLHLRPEKDIKQGSGQVHPDSNMLLLGMKNHVIDSLGLYASLIDAKVAPEEARMILPQNVMVNITWTGSLLFFARVVNQRVSANAQKASSELGKQISDIIRNLYPHCWQVLVGNR